MKITKTRYPFLDLAKITNTCWRFLNEGRCVGLQYRTKIEALADLERYVRENWTSALEH